LEIPNVSIQYILGVVVMVIASAALIIGFSWIGVPGKVGQGIGLIIVSVVAWAAFILVEKKAEAPILDLQVLFNRTFITAAGAAMFVMWSFSATTPIWLFVMVTALAGLGLGTIPTLNTLVAQFAVPKRLLGVAVGAIFFFVMMGMAIAPAILGLAQNSAPELEAGLKLVFLVGAVAMAISLLLIVTIPEVSMDVEVVDKQAPPAKSLPEAAD
jgi:hypothetical protein